MVLEILKKTPRPSVAGGSIWSATNDEIFWKTGTSQGFRDAWTVGIIGSYVLAVWVGNFDGKSNPALVGRDIAAPLFFEIADTLKDHRRLIDYPQDRDLKKVKVCSLSGQIPGLYCHHKKWTWFIPGKSPIRPCEIHREILVHVNTGKRLCQATHPKVKKVIFEFWPTDLLKLFDQAGLPRTKPPEWDLSCKINELAISGSPPRIVSPKLDVVYSIRVTLGSPPLRCDQTSLIANEIRKEGNFSFQN